MPQMAPISWLILFILFSVTFMIFNFLNFYCFNQSKSNLSNTNEMKSFNKNLMIWKW